ncbi:MAG TPA: ABC transporter permease [Terriglobales bacterium]|nr:ABC transporter permease [Terriglobales bacterium]
MMETLIQDIRYGLRMLGKSPGFVTVALITLAVGIGANVAIFSYVDELWLRPMPVPHADRVVRIFTGNPSSAGEIERGESSFPDFEDLKTNTKTLSGVALHQGRGAMLDDGVQNKLVTASVVSDNFFEVLEAKPAFGRLFTESEFRRSPALEIVLSYPFWRHQYNGDTSIVGQTIIVDREHVTVLGVLPRSFRGTEAMMVRDLWIPMSTFQQLSSERDNLASRKFRFYDLFARLRDGVTLQQARGELAGIAAQLAQAYPDTNTGRRLTVVPESQARGDEIASLGLTLLGVAALVLLIACSNVSSLLIARSEYRRHEIATRVALGASRLRIARQLMSETVILAVAGAVTALVLGDAVLRAFPSLMPQMSYSVGVDAYLSWRGFVAALGLAIAAMFLFGTIPAVLASRMMPIAALKQRGIESGRVRPTARNLLVVAQVALSLLLVVGAGLLVRSVWNGLALDPGFNAHQQMLVLEIAPDAGNAQNDMNFVREARRRIAMLPGVTSTTIGTRIPFGSSGGGMTYKVFVPGSLASNDREGATINFDPVGDQFFEVLGTRLVRGRAIEQHDSDTNARVVVINHQMATRFWPKDDPIGKRLRLEKIDGDEYVVIGVAEDGRYNDFEESPMPYFFLPMKLDDYSELTMAVKTSGDPGSLADPIRRTLRDINRNVAILGLLSLHEHVREALYEERVAAGLIASLGAVGLLLAAVGIYGLMSFIVRRRTQEIGVRLALGAQRSGIFRLIIGHALTLTVIGALIGAAGSVAATRTLKSLLIGVAPSDVFVFAAGVTVLVAVTFIAALTPAVSATRVDPMVALRYE